LFTEEYEEDDGMKILDTDTEAV
jgi:NFU1 iron-sulfur cluster scaffold homolog, mitochondrial